MTKLIALMGVRNEEWCLRLSTYLALQWADHLVVLDHNSTDATPGILDSLHAYNPDRVTVLHTDDPEWNEAQHRQAMLDAGRAAGGTHFALVDADEFLTANCVSFAKDMMLCAQPGEGWTMPWLCLWRSTKQVRVDDSPFGANNCQCKAWFADSQDVRYVAKDGYEFHQRFPKGLKAVKKLDAHDPDGGPVPWMGMLHLQHAVWDRLLWKHIWYQMKEVLRWGKIRANYAGTVNEDGLQLVDAPADWFKGIPMHLLDLKAEPWQKRECIQMFNMNDSIDMDNGCIDFFGLRPLLSDVL